MVRHKLAGSVAALCLLTSACGSNSSDAEADAATAAADSTVTTAAPDPTTSETPAETSVPDDEATATSATSATSAEPYPDGLRNVRYCEVLLLGKEGPDFVAHVWNTMGHGDCPQADWEALDAATLAAEHGAPLAILNGPRYWTLDSIDATMQLDAPVDTFGTIEMFEAATVNLGPELPNQAPYNERGVVRETVFRFDAGSEVYGLTSPDGKVYVMQSFSQQLDPAQTTEQLRSLGSRLTLPAGWTFSTKVLDETLELLSTDGIATVVQDDFQNTYQRYDAPAGAADSAL